MESARLTFEPIAERHAAELFEALGDPAVHEFIDAGDFLSHHAISEFIKRVQNGPHEISSDRWLNYVCVKGETVVGMVQATVHGEWAEIAYLFSPAFQGQGLATESVLWLIEHLRLELGVEEIWATTTPMNVRSVALLSRAGLREVQTWDREISSYELGDTVFKLING